jgi:predicted nucleic acid-binding protein
MHGSLDKTALVDTGFWIALLDERDGHHEDALNKSRILRNLAYILPWPSLYETLNTRLVRRPDRVRQFVQSFLKRPNAVILDDCCYRDSALEKTLSDKLMRKHPLSLVDNVLREIIADKNVRLNCLFTFNVGDFADVCKRRNLEVI